MELFYAYPKINLALDVLRKSDSGYHEIQTVLCRIKEPFDEIQIEYGDEIKIESNNAAIPNDERNTVYKAALYLQRETRTNAGARIYINKNIPVGAGLGGGSSNAAVVLVGLARLWGVNCGCGSAEGQNEMEHISADCLLKKIATQIGMDCSFFLGSEVAIGSHFGEDIKPINDLPENLKIQIIKTGQSISTAWAYDNLDIKKCGADTKKTARLISALREGDAHGVLKNIHNDFESLIFDAFPILAQKKEEIEKDDLKFGKKSRVLLSGSGGVLFRMEII